jgi:hypothetical protein
MGLISAPDKPEQPILSKKKKKKKTSKEVTEGLIRLELKPLAPNLIS